MTTPLGGASVVAMPTGSPVLSATIASPYAAALQPATTPTTMSAQQAVAAIPILKNMISVVNQIIAIKQAEQGAASLGTTANAVAGSYAAPTTGGGAAAAAGNDSFTLASFNVLGDSHTVKGGNAPKKYGDSGKRIKGAIETLRKHDVEVAGLQEFQKSQRADFKKLAPEYDIATAAGDAKGDNAVIWRKDRFKMIEKRSVTVKYFKGKAKPMPVVLLEDLKTGKRAWVISVHNPVAKENAKYRRYDEKVEADYVAKLRAETGLPVYLVGDFNDHEEAKEPLTTTGGLTSFHDGSFKLGIDQLFATPGVTFSNSLTDSSTRKAKISDHPIVVSETTM